jgi:hypothetical protein
VDVRAIGTVLNRLELLGFLQDGWLSREGLQGMEKAWDSCQYPPLSSWTVFLGPEREPPVS